jgi:hypothetical protein
MKLNLDWETWRRRDMLPALSYSTWDNIARFSLRQPFLPFVFTLGSMIDGKVDDKAGGFSMEQSHNLSLEYQPNDASRYAFSVRYRGQFGGIDGMANLIGWDLVSSYALGATRIEGMLSNSLSFTQDGFSELLAQLSARLSHTFPWNHTLSTQADFWLSYEKKTWSPFYSISLTYGVPFEVPVSRKPDTSAVTGFVFDATSGARIPGVVLRLDGLAAITNAKGEFTFYLPHAGDKYIQVDMSTVGPNMVPVKPMPLAVSAPKGSKIALEIGMVEACVVSGNVGEYGFPDQSAAYQSSSATGGGEETAEPERVRLKGLGGVIVELSDGTEVRRKLTNSNGDFSFEEVRPGAYTLRIAGGRIPSYHTIEPESLEFELSHGEKKYAEFRIMQERRVIKIIEPEISVELQVEPGVKENETILQKSAPTPAPGTGQK